jgi:hypothetical protein
MRKARWLPALVLGLVAVTGCRVGAEDRGFTKAPLESTGLWTTRERPVPVAGEPIRQVPFAATQPAQPPRPGAQQPTTSGPTQPAGVQPAQPEQGPQPQPEQGQQPQPQP